MNLRCVVFDLDDTLYLEREYVWSGFRALEPWVTSTLGLRNFQAKAWSLFVKGVRGTIFDEVLAQSGIRPEPETILTMIDLYRNHRPSIRLAPDATICLKRLYGKVDLALISDGPEVSQRNKIEALQVGWCFSNVVLTSALGSGFGKPHVRAFLAVQEKLGRRAQECVYVADNPRKDFVGPRRLGWRTVRIKRPGGLYSSVEGARGEGADYDISELSSLLGSIADI